MALFTPTVLWTYMPGKSLSGLLQTLWKCLLLLKLLIILYTHDIQEFPGIFDFNSFYPQTVIILPYIPYYMFFA